MHCDDKRTISALKQCIADSILEIQKAEDEFKLEEDDNKRMQIKTRISNLEKTIQYSKDQLLSTV